VIWNFLPKNNVERQTENILLGKLIKMFLKCSGVAKGGPKWAYAQPSAICGQTSKMLKNNQ